MNAEAHKALLELGTDIAPDTLVSRLSIAKRQLVQIARVLLTPHRVVIFDEPTASLDPVNRGVVLDLIEEAKARGAAILGIFHDAEARARVCDRSVDVGAFSPRSEAA